MRKPNYVLNRKQYQMIRKFDHNQMNEWATSVYKSGYEDGKKDAEGLTADEAREIILGIKGIGEKRAAVIIEALVVKMESKK